MTAACVTARPAQVYGPSFTGISNGQNTRDFLIGSKGILTGLTVHDYPLARHCDLPSYLVGIVWSVAGGHC
jgi:hypothetical protein